MQFHTILFLAKKLADAIYYFCCPENFDEEFPQIGEIDFSRVKLDLEEFWS